MYETKYCKCNTQQQLDCLGSRIYTRILLFLVLNKSQPNPFRVTQNVKFSGGRFFNGQLTFGSPISIAKKLTCNGIFNRNTSMFHGLYCYKVESVHFNCIQIRTAKSTVTIQLFHHTEIRQSLSVNCVYQNSYYPGLW